MQHPKAMMELTEQGCPIAFIAGAVQDCDDFTLTIYFIQRQFHK